MDRFIIGTGRCGSTLLSKMIREHPRVASLFEYWSGLPARERFSATPISGATFTEMICAEHPITGMVLARGYPVAEVAYPFGTPGARFSVEGGVPYVMNTFVPSLPVEDVDGLYDELRAFTLAQPLQPAAAHHRGLFGWITRRLGRELWVERSGGAIDYLAELAEQFPAARFLHIHRAGEEAALSMREHHVFRLGIMLAKRLRADASASEAESDPISQLLASRPDAEHFGRWWTDEVRRGFRALEGLDRARIHVVRFEDLVDGPPAVLAEVARFLELPDCAPGWRDRAVALVRGRPPTRADKLPADERERLEAACRPGNVLLGRA